MQQLTGQFRCLGYHEQRAAQERLTHQYDGSQHAVQIIKQGGEKAKAGQTQALILRRWAYILAG